LHPKKLPATEGEEVQKFRTKNPNPEAGNCFLPHKKLLAKEGEEVQKFGTKFRS
jgi:hypothetical protein